MDDEFLLAGGAQFPLALFTIIPRRKNEILGPYFGQYRERLPAQEKTNKVIDTVKIVDVPGRLSRLLISF